MSTDKDIQTIVPESSPLTETESTRDHLRILDDVTFAVTKEILRRGRKPATNGKAD